MLGVPVHSLGCGAKTFLLAEMGAGTHPGVLQRGSEGPWVRLRAGPVLLLPLCSAFPRAFPHALTSAAETSVLTVELPPGLVPAGGRAAAARRGGSQLGDASSSITVRNEYQNPAFI